MTPTIDTALDLIVPAPIVRMPSDHWAHLTAYLSTV